MKIIHRYIWNEFIQQFGICLAGFTALGIGRIVFDYNETFISYHLSARLIMSLILNQLPLLWMDVLPAATLFGIILALGRLVREREFDVIRVCGASLVKIMFPTLLGIGLICVGVYWWNDLVVTAANHRFETELRRLSMQDNMPLLKENVIFKAPGNRFIYLNKVQREKKVIDGILIFELGGGFGSGKWPRVINAKYGKIRSGIWELYDGVINEMDANGSIQAQLSYKKMEIKMSNDFTSMMGDQRSANEMRAGELLKTIIDSKKSGLYQPVYSVFYNAKFADPLISLVLLFLAVPLTLITGRNSRWLGIVLCFLIIIGYYALQVIGRTMGSDGLVAPWTAVWAPHLLFLSVGCFLLFATEQRR